MIKHTDVTTTIKIRTSFTWDDVTDDLITKFMKFSSDSQRWYQDIEFIFAPPDGAGVVEIPRYEVNSEEFSRILILAGQVSGGYFRKVALDIHSELMMAVLN